MPKLGEPPGSPPQTLQQGRRDTSAAGAAVQRSVMPSVMGFPILARFSIIAWGLPILFHSPLPLKGFLCGTRALLDPVHRATLNRDPSRRVGAFLALDEVRPSGSYRGQCRPFRGHSDVYITRVGLTLGSRDGRTETSSVAAGEAHTNTYVTFTHSHCPSVVSQLHPW